MDNNQKVAVVTGSSRGIGKAIAIRLAKDGYFVYVTHFTNNVGGQSTVEEIKKVGGEAFLQKVDVANENSVKELMAQVEKAFRITKSDLEARPIFLKLNETIKAHITIIFASLAISRILEIQTGESIHRILQTTSRIFTHTVENKKTKQTTTLETKLPNSEICGKLNKIYRLGY